MKTSIGALMILHFVLWDQVDAVAGLRVGRLICWVFKHQQTHSNPIRLLCARTTLCARPMTSQSTSAKSSHFAAIIIIIAVDDDDNVCRASDEVH